MPKSSKTKTPSIMTLSELLARKIAPSPLPLIFLTDKEWETWNKGAKPDKGKTPRPKKGIVLESRRFESLGGYLVEIRSYNKKAKLFAKMSQRGRRMMSIGEDLKPADALKKDPPSFDCGMVVNVTKDGPVCVGRCSTVHVGDYPRKGRCVNTRKVVQERVTVLRCVCLHY